MTNDTYKFRLETEHRGMRILNTFMIHPCMSRSLKPIDYNIGDPSVSAVALGNYQDNEHMLLEREQIVREVAHRIATGMLDAMARYDSKNGHPPLPTYEKAKS